MLKIKVAVSFPVDLTGVVMAGADGFKADMLDIRQTHIMPCPYHSVVYDTLRIYHQTVHIKDYALL